MEKLKTDRKTQLLTVGAAIVIAIAIAMTIMVVVRGENVSELSFAQRPKATPEALQNGVAARLNGEFVAPEKINAWPIGIMIENLITTRPQFGLADAGVVYETLAEGGITRFLVMFNGAPTSAKVGPVRSARAYYLDWVSEYDALYGHMGGSEEALAAIDGLKIRDIDGMYSGSKYYVRDRAIAAPHNLFTDGSKLDFALRDTELASKEATYEPWIFVDAQTAKDRQKNIPTGRGTVVSIDFSTADYAVKWSYDPINGVYLRENGGQIHVDGNGNRQIAAQNVIVQIIPPVKVLDLKGRLSVNVGGTGKAYVLKEGRITEGTWKKPSRTERTRYYDANGKEIELVRGKIWVEVVPQDRTVSFE